MALRNLRKLVTSGQPGLKLQRLKGADGNGKAVRVTLDGENEASLVLLDDLWDRSFLKYIPNGVMAVIPTRDVCVFIDMASVTGGGLGDLVDVVAQNAPGDGTAPSVTSFTVKTVNGRSAAA